MGSYHFTDITEICCIKNQVTLNATGPLKVMGCDLKPVSDVKPIPSQGSSCNIHINVLVSVDET